MNDLRYLRLLGATNLARKEMLEGREHVVVPVTALVEGVIRAVNSPHPEFVPAERFSVAPSGWNGRPIMLDHPMQDGEPISANDPDVLSSSIGKVFNTKVSSKRLLMEAWIDPVAAGKSDKGKSLLDRIAKGLPIEVSTGAHVTLRAGDGNHNGKAYKGTWDIIVPDHLAMLSQGQRGACSVEMGCGVRAALAYSPMYEVEENGTLKTLGGAGSGNFGHGSYSDHQAAAAAHSQAAQLHEAAAGQQGMGRGAASAASTAARVSSDKAAKASRGTGSKPYTSAAAHTYAKMAEKGSMKPVEAHREAAKQHYAAANWHESASKFGGKQRNSAEGGDVKMSDRLKSLLGLVKAELTAAAEGDTGDGEVGDPASLVVYDALTTLMGNATDSLSKSDELIADLIVAAKTYDEEDEEACEMACARLNALEAMCMSVYSAMNGVMDATRQQRRDWMREQNSATITVSPNVYRGARGARNSSTDQKTIQTVHDHAVALGANCDTTGMKAAAAKQFGKTLEDLTAEETASLRAACSCGNHDTTITIGGEGMTKTERIAALIACEHNPIKDKTVLDAATDAHLTALEAHAATGARLKAAASKADAEKVITDMADAHGAVLTHAAGVAAKKKKDEEGAAPPSDMKAAVDAAIAAAMPKTEEDWLKIAPPTVRALVEETKVEREAQKTVLVTKLKAAQSVYDETTLKAMDLKQLKEIALLTKIEPVDFSLNGPRIASQGGESYMTQPPPDGYRIALGKDKKPGAQEGKVN